MICCKISINENVFVPKNFNNRSINKKKLIRSNTVAKQNHHKSNITRRHVISTIAYLSPYLFTLNKYASGADEEIVIASSSVKTPKKKYSFEEFKSFKNDFKFKYLAEWILAFDRTESQSIGII